MFHIAFILNLTFRVVTNKYLLPRKSANRIQVLRINTNSCIFLFNKNFVKATSIKNSKSKVRNDLEKM